MRRPIVRIVMAAIGVVSMTVYVAAGVGLYLVFGALWADRPSAAMIVLTVVVVTLVFGYWSYRTGTRRLLAGLHARELTEMGAPSLQQRYARLCDRSDLDQRPRLLVAEMGEPNALATGHRDRGVVVLDSSLLSLLTLEELEAILAHELAHLEARDSLTQVIAFTAVETVVELAMIALLPVLLVVTGVAKAIAWARGQPGAWTRTFAGRLRLLIAGLVLLVPTVVTLAILAYSRRREFAADDRGTELTGRPLALASALEKIHSHTGATLGIRDALDSDESPLGRLLATHPAIDQRIERLRERARHRQSAGRAQLRRRT
jgi:heat shock protein HtpX